MSNTVALQREGPGFGPLGGVVSVWVLCSDWVYSGSSNFLQHYKNMQPGLISENEILYR